MIKTHPLVIMIDDSTSTLEEWQNTLGQEVTFKGFITPFDFEEALDNDNTLIKADYILVDFNFGNENAGELDIVSFLRSKSYLGKVILCSIYEKFGEHDAKIRRDFDAVIRKKPLTFSQLIKIAGNKI
jgi:hypothetical protein